MRLCVSIRIHVEQLLSADLKGDGELLNGREAGVPAHFCTTNRALLDTGLLCEFALSQEFREAPNAQLRYWDAVQMSSLSHTFHLQFAV
jgi:hypothetical protein